MEEPFKPQSLSIKGLFGNADSLYKIPQYQRPYKWEDEQVDKLWADIYEAFEEADDNYFLGSIITAKPRDDEKSAYIDVVDGQQRLTTLMILFCVLRDLFPTLGEGRMESDPNAVDSDTINSSISLHGKMKRLKLFTHHQHQSDFESLILNASVLGLQKPYKYQIKTDEEPKFKFINTAVIFREKLKGIGQAKAEQLIDFLFNQVKIIRIDCKNRDFAIKLFQVLNDRGMDLTPADLIKSYLLENLYKKHQADPDTSKLREQQFIADWREMEQGIKSSDINLNDLFIIYAYFRLGRNPRKSLYDELQEELKSDDPNAVIQEIKLFANNYVTSIFESEDKVLYSLWYIRWNVHWKAILLAALHNGYSEYASLVAGLRRFYYLYWIAGKTLSAIKQTSFNLIVWIKNRKPWAEIKVELEKKLKDDDIIEAALRSLTLESIAREYWCKPLLLLLEYNATDSAHPRFFELNSEIHLEHVLPVKFASIKEWNHISKETGSKWLHSAGNLTLLGGTKNIEASNNPFPIKMSVYRGKGKYDIKDTKITEFSITRAIVQDCEKGTFGKNWTEEAIVARWKWFFKEVGEILAIDVQKAIDLHDPAVE